MSYIIRAISLNVLLVGMFLLLYLDYQGVIYTSVYYLLGLLLVIVGWCVPLLKPSSKIISFAFDRRYVWAAFIAYSLIIIHLRGYSLGSLLSFFDNREDFVASQEGMGTFFILYFEVFFGYWLACFFKKSLSLPYFFLIILIFTLLVFSVPI